MASAGARAYNEGLGVEPPAGIQGAEPPVGGQGGFAPLKLMAWSGMCSATDRARLDSLLRRSKRLG